MIGIIIKQLDMHSYIMTFVVLVQLMTLQLH